MTAGPANRMVTPLPRNKPTPIAPPMAIMVSCLWLSRRCRPSPSFLGDVSGRSAAAATACCWSVMAGDTGRGEGQKMNVLPENFGDSVNVVERVVDVERDPQSIETAGCYDAVLRQRLQQLS